MDKEKLWILLWLAQEKKSIWSPKTKYVLLNNLDINELQVEQIWIVAEKLIDYWKPISRMKRAWKIAEKEIYDKLKDYYDSI